MGYLKIERLPTTSVLSKHLDFFFFSQHLIFQGMVFLTGVFFRFVGEAYPGKLA